MKKTTNQLTLLLLLALCFVITSVNAQDLYLIIGQSNASGRDVDGIDHDGEDSETSDVQLLSAGGRFWSAKQPLNRHSSIRKDLDEQGVNLGLEFGKEMHDYNGKTVYLVVNARGASKIAQWRKDHSSYDYYNEALARIDDAMDACTTCDLKGILWHQGEGDTKSDLEDEIGYNSHYFNSLEDLIQNFRSDFKDSGYISNENDLPFIVGQLAKDEPEKKEINKRFNNALRVVDDSDYALDNVEWVTSNNLTTFDGTHFDAESTRILGRRYADKMQQFVSSSSNKEIVTVENISSLDINVFPNPTNETIHISGTDEGETFEIFNLMGSKVIASSTPDIDISTLASGHYYIITSKGRSENLKFIKD